MIMDTRTILTQDERPIKAVFFYGENAGGYAIGQTVRSVGEIARHYWGVYVEEARRCDHHRTFGRVPPNETISPSEMSADVIEFPGRDTASSEVQP